MAGACCGHLRKRKRGVLRPGYYTAFTKITTLMKEIWGEDAAMGVFMFERCIFDHWGRREHRCGMCIL